MDDFIDIALKFLEPQIEPATYILLLQALIPIGVLLGHILFSYYTHLFNKDKISKQTLEKTKAITVLIILALVFIGYVILFMTIWKRITQNG